MPYTDKEKLPHGMVPGDCLVHSGRRSDPDGWFIFPQTYELGPQNLQFGVSAAGARRMAQLAPQFGLVPRESLDAERELSEHLARENLALKDKLAQLVAWRDNISGIVREDHNAPRFRTTNKRGPQTKPEEVQV